MVLYHVLCLYGGQWPFIPISPTPMIPGLLLLTQFRMPLFFFISGFLFSYLALERGKYQKYGPFLWNKFKRLMIPYFVFATLMIATGTTLRGDRNFIDLIIGVDHLWFLPVLFFCFVVCGGLIHTRRIWVWSVVVLGIVLGSWVLYLNEIEIFAANDLWRFLPCFLLGYVCQIFRDSPFLVKLRSNWGLVLLFVLYLLIFFGGYKYIGELSLPIRMIGYMMAVLFFWGLTHRLFKAGKVYMTEILRRIEKCSYGIFVFHHWFINSILHISWILAFADNHRILYPLICFPLTLGVSYGVTSLLLRTRVGRFLLG